MKFRQLLWLDPGGVGGGGVMSYLTLVTETISFKSSYNIDLKAPLSFFLFLSLPLSAYQQYICQF